MVSAGLTAVSKLIARHGKTCSTAFETNATSLAPLTPAGCGLAAAGLLFEYLGMLRAVGPQRWAYDEQAAIAQMRFRFQVGQAVVVVVSIVVSLALPCCQALWLRFRLIALL